MLPAGEGGGGESGPNIYLCPKPKVKKGGLLAQLLQGGVDISGQSVVKLQNPIRMIHALLITMRYIRLIYQSNRISHRGFNYSEEGMRGKGDDFFFPKLKISL